MMHARPTVRRNNLLTSLQKNSKRLTQYEVAMEIQRQEARERLTVVESEDMDDIDFRNLNLDYENNKEKWCKFTVAYLAALTPIKLRDILYHKEFTRFLQKKTSEGTRLKFVHAVVNDTSCTAEQEPS